jgi:hypothetical protein
VDAIERLHTAEMIGRTAPTPGQASAMAPTARARMPRTIRDVLDDFSMTVPFASPYARSTDLGQVSA